MSDGTRTRDRLDHNQELYQLSYAHQAGSEGTPMRSGPTGVYEWCSASAASASSFVRWTVSGGCSGGE